MVWIYASWLIVLFGLEIVYAHQHRRTFLNDLHGSRLNQTSREIVGLSILLATAEAYQKDGRPWTLHRLADELNVPVRLVRDLLDQLLESGYIVAGDGEDPSFYPARASEHVPIAEVVEDLRHMGHAFSATGMSTYRDVAAELMSEMGITPRDSGLTLHDAVERLSPH
jgi:membrane protein